MSKCAYCEIKHEKLTCVEGYKRHVKFHFIPLKKFSSSNNFHIFIETHIVIFLSNNYSISETEVLFVSRYDSNLNFFIISGFFSPYGIKCNSEHEIISLFHLSWGYVSEKNYSGK